MIYPIAAGAAALAAITGVCWKGIVRADGQEIGGSWRVRWACTRWIAETKRVGSTSWSRVGVYIDKSAAVDAARGLTLLPPGALAAMGGAIRTLKLVGPSG